MRWNYSVTESLVNSYLALDIKDICSNSYNAANENHCAHFVSHVLNLDFGMTCRKLVSSTKRQAPGANVRVQEVFAACPEVEELNMCPTQGAALIFVSAPANFHGSPAQLRNVPKKHIGIIVNGRVWHYSNSRDQVVVQILAEFIRHYPRQTNALWIGSFPLGAQPANYGGLACHA